MMLSKLVNVISLRSAPLTVMPASTGTGSEAASIAPNIVPGSRSMYKLATRTPRRCAPSTRLKA